MRALSRLTAALTMLILSAFLLTGCGPDAFSTQCSKDGGVEHVNHDSAGHPTARICLKGGKVVHHAPLPTPAGNAGW